MPMKTFSDIEQHLIEKNKKYKTAIVAPSDMKTLRAVMTAFHKNLIEPIFVGDEQLLIKNAEEKQIDISNIEVIDFQEPYKALETAGKLACEGEIDIIIKGRYHPAEFVKRLFHENCEFCNLQNVQHISVCMANEYKKFLLLTDGFIHCQPDITVKSNLINGTVKLANQFGISLPKVALLAAVEVIYKQMPVTVEADILKNMYKDRTDFCLVDGPLSLDIAINNQAVKAKQFRASSVAGDADILVAPNIETANGMYKVLSLFSDSELGGVITGAKVPVVVPSPIDSEQTRYNSILLSLIAYHLSY